MKQTKYTVWLEIVSEDIQKDLTKLVKGNKINILRTVEGGL